MKHPQPGVGCGPPCDWAGSGGIADEDTNRGTTQILTVVHAATATQAAGAALRTGRKNTKLKKVADRICHDIIENKRFNTSLQELASEEIVNDSLDAARKYYAAFPPLQKEKNNTRGHIMPAAPSWCRKPLNSSKHKGAIETETDISRDWFNNRSRRTLGQKIRRNSYHGQRKNSTSKRRCHSYSKSGESEALPEWVTHEGSWDMETQDPIKEFIRALAMDEGYGTCENTMADDALSYRIDKPIECSHIEQFGNARLETNLFKDENVVSPIKCSTEEEETLASFKAKFDRSLEALWLRDQANTPDDECQDLPVDFQELLSSPSDDPNIKYVASHLSGGSIWSTSSDRAEDVFNAKGNIWSYNNKWEEGCKVWNECEDSKESMEMISSILRPLNIKDDSLHSPDSLFPSMPYAAPAWSWDNVREERAEAHASLWSDEDVDGEPSSLYRQHEIFDSVPSVAKIMRSLTTLNHNKQLSSFTEVIPKWPTGFVGDGRPTKFSSHPFSDSKFKDDMGGVDQKDEEDLLSSMRTHFKPIKLDSNDPANGNVVNFVDGTTFSIMSDLEEVHFTRSQTGTMFLESDSEPPKQYMEYRAKLTDKINFKHNSKVFCDESDTGFILKFQVRKMEKAVQTDDLQVEPERSEGTPAKKILLCDRASNENILSVHEALKTANQLNVNTEEAELVKIQNEKSAKELWKVCEDCKSEDVWKFDGKRVELIQTDVNISKIWSSKKGTCRTCNGGLTVQIGRINDTAPKDDSKDWDELLSDISFMHNLSIDRGNNCKEFKQNNNSCIAPTEESYSAPDGNFIKSALKFIEVKHSQFAEISSSGIVALCCEISTCEDHSDEKEASDEKESWRCDRKRRHSATGRGAGGKYAALRAERVCDALGAHCPLPHDAPFLSCYSSDRPLTR